jgi:beta-alanine--pyruvate transaminase
MTCAIIPFAESAAAATSRFVVNRLEGFPRQAANQHRPFNASEGLDAPLGARPPAPAPAPVDAELDGSALAKQLLQLAPDGFRHAVLTQSHAQAIELAARLCRAFHQARGEPQRTGIVARDLDGAELSPIARLRHTGLAANHFTRGRPVEGARRADDLRRIVSRPNGRLAASCLVEPLAVAAGLLVPPQGYLERLRAICDAHGLLLVFDEAASGLGHAGAALACESLGIMPDLVVLGAAITNGEHPLGAVLLRDEIGAMVLGSRETAAIMLNGAAPPTPEAMSAGSATLGLCRRERLFDRAARLAPTFLDAVFSLSDLPVIADIRGFGMRAAIDFLPSRIAGARGREIQARLEAAGLAVAMRGDTALLAPALTIEEWQIARMAAILREALSPRRWVAAPRRDPAQARSLMIFRQARR